MEFSYLFLGYVSYWIHYYSYTPAYDKEKANYCLTVVFISGIIINILGLITILLL